MRDKNEKTRLNKTKRRLGKAKKVGMNGGSYSLDGSYGLGTITKYEERTKKNLQCPHETSNGMCRVEQSQRQKKSSAVTSSMVSGA